MNDEKYLTGKQGIFNHYNKFEADALLLEMYKGWFLHNAPDVDSDKMIDMLLFYSEVKSLLMKMPFPDPQSLQ